MSAHGQALLQGPGMIRMSTQGRMDQGTTQKIIPRIRTPHAALESALADRSEPCLSPRQHDASKTTIVSSLVISVLTNLEERMPLASAHIDRLQWAPLYAPYTDGFLAFLTAPAPAAIGTLPGGTIPQSPLPRSVPSDLTEIGAAQLAMEIGEDTERKWRMYNERETYSFDEDVDE